MIDYSRNWLFINKEEQLQLAEKKLLIGGAGIGSFFAMAALRTGFRNFIIADGDTVSASNLNRQDYSLAQVGENKAVACSQNLLAIDKGIKVDAIDRYLNRADLAELLPQVDFVSNTIDFDCPEFLQCHQLAKKHQVIEIFPINLGFGAAVIVHTPGSPSFEDVFGPMDDHMLLKQKILDLIMRSNQASDFLKSSYQTYLQGEHPGYDPQTASAVAMASAMMVDLMVAMVQGAKVQAFPYVYLLDTRLVPRE